VPLWMSDYSNKLTRDAIIQNRNNPSILFYESGSGLNLIELEIYGKRVGNEQ
jgi:hypothetical protein